MKEIYQTGDLQYPLRTAPFILEIKQGLHAFKDVQAELEAIVDEVETNAIWAAKNGMPEKVDMKFWDKFVEQVYLENHNSYYK